MYKRFWSDRLKNIRMVNGQINGDCFACNKVRHFYANIDTGQFDCKLCGITGNAITYLRDYEHKDNRQIAECLKSYQINEDNHIQPISLNPTPKKIFEERLIDFYVSNLPEDKLKEFSRERGLPVEILKKYKVGLDNEGNFTLPVYDEKGKIRDIRRKRIGGDTISSIGADVFLFGIEDLLSNDRIFLTEGEWSKMALEVQGYASVGVPGASVFKDEWIPYFKGKEVYIVYDLDSGGENGAKKVCEKLGSLVKEIKVIHLPKELGEGNDVRNFFNNGGTKEQFEELIKQTEVVKKGIFAEPIDVLDLVNTDIPQSDSFWGDGIIDVKSKAVISGQGKIGKTNFTLNLALSLATGKTFLDITILRETKVLYLQQEVSEANLQKRLKAMLQTISNLESGYLACNTIRGFNLHIQDHLKELKSWLKKGQFEVVIFDPFYKFHNEEENSAQDMKILLDVFDSLIGEFGISIILIHHHRKVGRDEQKSFQLLRGSSVLFDWGDTYIALNYHKGEKGAIKIDWKLRNAEEPASILVKRDENLWYIKLAELGKRKYEISDIVEIVKSFGKEIVSQKDIIEEVKKQKNISAGTIRNLLKEGEKEGLWKAEKLKGIGIGWRLK